MAFGFAGAGAGASDALQALLQQEFLRKQQEEQAARAQQQLMLQAEGQRLDGERQTADLSYRTQQTERQGRMDDIAAADRRQGQNQQGVRRMIGDFLMQRGSQPLDQGARNQVTGMAVSEDVDLPRTLLEDPMAGSQHALDLEKLRHTNDMTEIAARGGEDRRTASAAAASRANPPAGQPSPYAAERNARTLQSVEELIGKVGGMTAGFGSISARIPGTPARDFSAELDTLKANIAFNELTEMREASKTGGALGSVAVRELALLESTLGALDQGQSPENLKAQLQKVRENIIRWQAAKGAASPMPSHGGPAQSAPAANRVGRFEIVSVQ
jgi:hypothetical protein